MQLLKAQQELIDETKVKTIMIVGAYGSGKTNALAFKSLQNDFSLSVSLDRNLLKHETIPVYKEILEKDNYSINLCEQIIRIDTTKIILKTYDDILKIIGMQHDTTILLDNFNDIPDKQAQEFFNKMVARRPKQIIISVSPAGVKEESFVRYLSKKVKVINFSLLDNPHIPKDFINELREKIELPDNYLKGEFVTNDNL